MPAFSLCAKHMLRGKGQREVNGRVDVSLTFGRRRADRLADKVDGFVHEGRLRKRFACKTDKFVDERESAERRPVRLYLGASAFRYKEVSRAF